MEFRIADTFTDSLTKLTNEEQKAVKTTAFDLQLNPANPGMQFHKLDKARDANFWSVRVSRDIRLIVHKSKASLLLCYVDHHDAAYKWAEGRKLETHPKTGAAQVVELQETIKEITIPKFVEVEQAKPLLFQDVSDEDLLGYGVPLEWIAQVRQANEDSILDMAGHLPGEAAEALLDLATGVTPQLSIEIDKTTNPFEHPDAQRRFRVVNNLEELKRALDYPWEKWTVFLHPAQQELVEREFNGPARVSGTAGTGKTIVALHRAVYLARKNPDTRILLTTFSSSLANVLRKKLQLLILHEPRLGERLEVHAINEIAERLYELNFSRAQIATDMEIKKLIEEIAEEVDTQKFSLHFLFTEWQQVVDAWQLKSWEDYRDVARLGRKTRLPENRRKVLWSIFQEVRSKIKHKGMVTYPDLFSQLATWLDQSKHAPFDFAIIDESQDLNVAQLRFLAAFENNRPNALFFSGDLGQRIFQQPFSWKSLGVDIRGRAKTLRINYRTSHQIRKQADKLLGPTVADVDGNVEERKGAISVFNSSVPIIKEYKTVDEEVDGVSDWLIKRTEEGILPHEIGVFVRSPKEIGRGQQAVEKAGLPFKILDENIETTIGYLSISTMHLAKGMEFKAVVVLACDDEVIPSQERIETVVDDNDLEDVYNTERHLLYVASTRARDYLLVTGVEPASEFIDDLRL